jgi:phosphopentomutase
MRVFLTVLDSLGIGELPDAHLYGDEGSNTLKAIYSSSFLHVPNLRQMGLFNIEGAPDNGVDKPSAAFCRMIEKSKGKDTVTGHWEMCQIISEKPFPTYPNGFPREIIETFENLTGKKTLCNLPYSGTEVIKDYGEESIKDNKLIVYTSADSVFQIAAHEDYVPVQDLYKYCEIARNMLSGNHAVGRVIARPFNGPVGDFKRTSNRHDYSLTPPQNTLNILKDSGKDVISIGKIKDIFAGVGITKSLPGSNNSDAFASLTEMLDNDFNGLCFANFVDFDAVFGHRNNIDGYAKAVSEFDSFLNTVFSKLREDDIFILTSDHGCDPSTASTDHSREYAFSLFYGKKIIPSNLGTFTSFADLGKTICGFLDIKNDLTGIDHSYKILKKRT